MKLDPDSLLNMSIGTVNDGVLTYNNANNPGFLTNAQNLLSLDDSFLDQTQA